MQYGFEREFFLKSGKDWSAAKREIPHDGCGWLAEARSEPSQSIVKAVFLLRSAEYSLVQKAREFKLRLALDTKVVLPRDVLKQARRTFGKKYGDVGKGNIYGHEEEFKDLTQDTAYAGLHIHFSDWYEQTHYTSKGGETKVKVHTPLDMVRWIRALDAEFAEEIEKADRLPGWYQMKAYGFEYRSLPNNIRPERLIRALSEIEKGKDQ